MRWVQTETQDGKACGIILIHFHGQYATGFYREGDREWSNGHYNDSLEEATKDFNERVASRKRK